jgi:hypothetical protein
MEMDAPEIPAQVHYSFARAPSREVAKFSLSFIQVAEVLSDQQC